MDLKFTKLLLFVLVLLSLILSGCEGVNVSERDINRISEGIIQSGEQCDSSVLGGASCVSEGFSSGVLACSSSCAFDTAQCTSAVCGNNILEGFEVCDGSVLGGASCVSEGFSSGVLACASDCGSLNTAGCVSGSGSLSARINATRVSCVAPCMVSFDALGTSHSNSGVSVLHDLNFKWNFGDDSSAVWAVNGKSKNLAVGAVAAHVFDPDFAGASSKTFTVSLTSSDGRGNADSS